MKLPIAIAFAAVYGFFLRITFGFFDELSGVMSLSFLVLAPSVIGFLTVFLVPKSTRISNTSAFFRPWITSLVIMVITMIADVEGTICWIIIYPIFSIAAGIGGLIANQIRTRSQDQAEQENYDEWTKPDKMTAGAIMFLPLLVAIVEGQHLQEKKFITIRQEVVVNSSSNNVWLQMVHIESIHPKEHAASLASWIGFPRHLHTSLDSMAVGGKRKAVYEKGLYFDETISRCVPSQLLVLDVKTDPLKIPPTVMDEHILIGGEHVDILQDTYQLEDLPGGKCRISLSSKFFISTPINWYAGIWAKYLMGDILNGQLMLLKNRAEQTLITATTL